LFSKAVLKLDAIAHFWRKPKVALFRWWEYAGKMEKRKVLSRIFQILFRIFLNIRSIKNFNVYIDSWTEKKQK